MVSFFDVTNRLYVKEVGECPFINVSRLESSDKKSPRNVRPDFTHLFERMSVT